MLCFCMIAIPKTLSWLTKYVLFLHTVYRFMSTSKKFLAQSNRFNSIFDPTEYALKQSGSEWDKTEHKTENNFQAIFFLFFSEGGTAVRFFPRRKTARKWPIIKRRKNAKIVQGNYSRIWYLLFSPSRLVPDWGIYYDFEPRNNKFSPFIGLGWGTIQF